MGGRSGPRDASSSRTTYGRRKGAWAVVALGIVASYLMVGVAPASAAVVTGMAPNNGSAAGGTTVTFGGTFNTARRATTVTFGTTAVTGVTCAANSCTVTTPRSAVGTVNVTVNDGGLVANAGTFTFRPVVSKLSPATGPSAGGTGVRIDGNGFVPGATTVLFGGIASPNVNCTSATRCDAASPANVGNVAVSVVVGGIASTQNAAFAYTSPVPTITALAPTVGPLAGGTAVTLTGTGFFPGIPGATTVRFGNTPVTAVCVSTTSCTATTPSTLTAGAVPVVVTVGGQSSSAASFVYANALTAPAITSIAPAAGALAGGNRVTLTGTNLGSVVSIRFGATAGTNPVCTATSCAVTAPAGAALGAVQLTANNGLASNPLAYTYEPTTQAPPLTPHSIIAFPQRDFVSTQGFEIANGPYRIELRSADNTLRSVAVDPASSPQLVPTLVDGIPTLEVNHPGGACWSGSTPDIAPGDRIVVIGANGVTSRIVVSGITTTAPVDTSVPGTFSVQVRGRAVDPLGNPLLASEIEHRFVNPTFVDLGGKRTLRATTGGVLAGDAGTLVLDGAGNYTATYVLPSQAWLDATMAAESRGVWLGAGATGVDSTIYEVGSLVAPGPAAPCTAPLEPDTQVPSQPTGLAVTMTLDNADLVWTASTDNRAVDHYDIERRLVGAPAFALVASTTNTTYDDLHVAVGSYEWRVIAVDTSNNRSLPSVIATGNASTSTAPDLSVTLANSPSLLVVGGTGSVTLTATNVGTVATTGAVNLTLTLPNGLSATSFNSTTAGLVCTIATPVPNAVACTTTNVMAVGATISFDTNVSVTAPAFPSVTVTGSSATAGDTVTVNSQAVTRTIAVNVAAVTVNDPPRTDRVVIAFPARDYISGEGYTPGAPHTVQVIRNGNVVGSARGVLADAAGLLDINHLAPICWDTVTPRLQPFDVVRIIDPAGVADQTTIANVRTLYTESLGNGTIRVRGIAQDANGNPIDVGFIEQRIIGSSGDPFDKSGKRSLRADSTAQQDGVLVYDAPGSVNWTATYSGLSPHDVDLALTSEARIQWLGRDALLGNELTIFENGPLVATGPAAGCAAPSDLASVLPAPSVTVRITPSGNFTVGQTNATLAVRVRNTGNAATAGLAIASVNLPAGLTPKGLASISDTAGNVWACTTTDSRVECVRTGALAAGADETITIGVNVSGAAVGTVIATVEVAAGLDADPAGNWDATDVSVAASAVLSDLGIQASHTGVFTQGVIGLANLVVGNHGTQSVTGLTVTDTMPAGWTFGGTPTAGWVCNAAASTVTCTNAGIILAANASTALVLRLTPGAAPLLAAPTTVTTSASVVNAGDANPSDNTATDAVVVNPNPSEPPTSGVSVLAFASRDFVSSQGFQPTDGPITFRVIRNGLTISTSAPVPLFDDPSTTAYDGIAEVNHPGGGCWNTVTPDIRPGDKVQAITAAGIIHQTTVANVAVTGARQVGPTTFEVHGIALSPTNAPLPIAQLEVRIRAGGGSTFATNGRNTLRAPLDGTLAFDAPGSAAFTARFAVNAADVAALTTAETRIHWLGQNPLSLAEATIFEYGTGIAGGPSAPCTAAPGAPAPVNGRAELTLTAVRNGNNIEFTVANGSVAGTVTARNLRVVIVTTGGVQTLPFGDLGQGGRSTQRWNNAPVGSILFAYVISDQADTNVNDSVVYGTF